MTIRVIQSRWVIAVLLLSSAEALATATGSNLGMPRHGLVKPIEASRAFDIDITPPVVVEISPRADAVVRELTQIEVVFDGNVQGVDAADLLINGQPATDVTVYSPRDYLFRFPEPAVGRVEVAWALGHGITDQASPPNTFAGGNWSYTLERSRPVSSVIISELMADNESGIRDDDSDRSDWIELLNLGPEEVNLEGWYLTDTVINLSRWRFPAVHLGVNEYLLVWASQKNRTNPLAPLHTDFKLEKDGEYLALIDPGTNVASEFYPSYPPQTANVSYGRDRVSPSVVGYFYTPTPGAPNSTAGPGFAPAPLFSEDSGVFTNAWLAVALSAPSGTIHYTVDGSLPTTNSAIFSTPLVISASAVVKARTFQEGLLPSEIVAKSYLLLDSAAANFSSTLPVMIYSTGGRGIAQDILPGQPRTFASVAVFDTFRGRSSVSRKPDYQGLCELEVRGQSSAGFPKKPYNVEIQDAYRNDLAVSLAGLPAESDWVLCNPYSDKPFLQNCLALELHEKMGHYAVRRRFVEVFVNTVAGRVTYPRDYAGIYLLMEKIEIGKNRLDLERLSPYDNAEPDITGGYIFKKDKDSQGDLNFTTVGGGGFSRQVLKIHDPKPREITPAQFGWLRNYVNQFERALYAPNWTKATGTNHYSWYIDVDSFVDNHWIVEFSKQIDGYRLSNFIHKNRGGKIKMAPIWDWNLSFGNADYLEGWMTNGWYYPLISENEHLWLRRLINGTPSGTGTSGDPDFNQKIIDRWSVLRTNIFAASNVLARVDELAALLTEPAARDFKKWPRLGTYIWPNPEFYVKPTTYAGIIAAMKKWIQGRYAWIDAQFVRCPMLSVNGGPVPMGFSLTISAPAGTTYYTLDGSDPRLAGGGVSPGAFVYSAPVSLNANARVFARARSGSKWSGPTAATFVVRRPPLLITEIMYHPGEPPPGCTNEAGDFAYVELKNSGATTVNLDGYRLSGAIAFTFSNQILAAGQRILVVRNRSAFESRYGTSHAIAGEYVGQLGNGERRLILTGPLQEPVLEFSFDTRWYPVADGAGFSLVAVDEDTPVETWGCKEQWRASTTVHGSPGEPDPPHVVHPRVVISEVLSHPAPGARDAIEVQNLSETDVDISGWFLTDDFYTPKKYRVPHGTAIPAGGFLVFSAMEASGGGAEGLPFGVSALGDEAYLFSGDANTNLTGYIHGFTFDAQKAGVTFGRYVTSDGKEHFVAQRANTMGGPNAGPWIGPVVISEIMYHPPDVLTNGASWDNGEDEYIELHNRSSAPVNLFDPAHSGNRWRLARAVEFQFPDETVLAPGGYLLVVSFDPALEPAQLAAFVARYSVPIGVPILGPYRGRLRNSGDKVALYEPDEPVPAGPASGEVPYVLVDQVHYSDQPPWPPAADGMGHALNRRDPTQFGDDPANWDGSVPTPGRAYLGGAAPIITSQPRGRLALASQLVVLGVSAESVGPVRYQWRYNGMNIAGATNETLVLTNVQPQQTGEYQVVVLNLTSSVVSEAAWLTIENDSDADGMGDPWELAHGFNPYHGGDADTDADQDGMSNLNEYLAGTDPRDSRSGLKIEGIVASDGVTLWFTAVSNRTYAIEASDALHLSRWTRLIKVDSRSTNRTDRVTDSRSNAERYYRLVLVP